MRTASSSDIGELLFGKTRRAILRLLLSNPEQEIHLRAVVRLSGSGVGPVQRELKLLRDAGILLQRQAGNRSYFRADPECPPYHELRHLIAKLDGFPQAVARTSPRQTAEIVSDKVTDSLPPAAAPSWEAVLDL